MDDALYEAPRQATGGSAAPPNPRSKYVSPFFLCLLPVPIPDSRRSWFLVDAFAPGSAG